ncbi:Crp/Fnr family transcriptional regulator [Herbaspirillum sp. LeCh32-8]|uniref:Crp/Fnr family transcriptional regulator n=1 Tax=Herbaspirillum sp. LeCh32-8 TaxID=2821356 RepID=UPI001AE61894|nr:Crp/Fnr family transcriptional regulator [Herbaspirillum sp. LeCh32-8]MBP0599159.1 Crp/Fnr family transcriptional regulator [Herbaspirillum sp. LeCh32-8]
MLNRFQGDSGRRLRIDAFKNQKLVAGDAKLAEILADEAELVHVPVGTSLIVQTEYTNDVYFILVGAFAIVVNGREIAIRGPREHVGEMGAIEPTQPRSATVTAKEDSLVAKLSEEAFAKLATQFPFLYKNIAQELSRRLLERNSLVKPVHHKIRIFIISSAESLPIARLIHSVLNCTEN